MIAALGDSITKEVTASVPCITLLMTPAYACPDGTGYLPTAAKILDSYEPTAFQNLAVKGAGSAAITLTQVPLLSPEANVVVVFEGSGDRLRVGGLRLERYVPYPLSRWKEDYAWMIQSIHARAPRARVIIATIPNPAYVPYYVNEPNPKYILSPRERNRAGAATLAMDRYIASRSEDILDLRCFPDFYNVATLDNGFWYLNDAGYADVGRRVAAIIRTSGTVHASACPQYTRSV